MRNGKVGGCICVLALVLPAALAAAPRNVLFSPSAAGVEAFDFVEIVIHVDGADARNPFTDVAINGSFGKVGAGERKTVEGFCDSPDGSLFRIRFMPDAAGDYSYSVSYRQGEYSKSTEGNFHALQTHRRGPIRVDPKYPWHFIWEGTGENYFFNGTTAFWLMGWRDDRIIDSSIERLHSLKINRLRVLLSGAANIFWGEAVMP